MRSRRLSLYLLARVLEALGASNTQLDAGDCDGSDPDANQYELGAQLREPTLERMHDGVVPGHRSEHQRLLPQSKRPRDTLKARYY